MDEMKCLCGATYISTYWRAIVDNKVSTIFGLTCTTPRCEANIRQKHEERVKKYELRRET